MAATKSGSAVIAAQTSSAGSTYGSPSSGCQSSDQSQTTNYGAVWTLHMVNGATGPTIGCSGQIDISYDGSTWRQLATVTGGVTISATYDFVIELAPAVMHTRVTFFGNTGQSVTVSAEIEQLTGI